MNNPNLTTPETKITANRYEGLDEKEVKRINKGKTIDLAWCIGFFGKRGKETYGEKFKIYEEDYEILYKLIIYFLAHHEEAKRLNIDLRKGILLTGPVGCGKTTLMNLLRFTTQAENSYSLKSCREISFEFTQDGYEVINKYSRLSFSNNLPKIFCFDDLGAEQAIKYYGNQCNIMAEVLMSRYEFFISTHMLSHITTNLSASDIQSEYGVRVRSRMREMFNHLSWQVNSKDKRS